MKELPTISIQAARKLVNFAGGPMLPEIAESQLEGAVAMHNLLARKGFAYLADEVGMGKTYVALGAVAMLRYLNPGFRVLYIAPRENIQRKWIKELRNFVATNWLHADQRVRTVQGTPAVGLAFCDGLMDWTRKAVLDPNRNFFMRLSSFSFALLDDPSTWGSKRKELLDLLPLSEKARVKAFLRTRDKEVFKRNYALALNTLLPHYDLVVVDEAHNLKHGRSSGASRNQLIQYVLGTNESEEAASWPGYGKRFERLLLLSATPLESEYNQLWNQLDLFGFGDTVAELADREVTEEQQQKVAASFLIRRLANLEIAGRRHTKNMYRREWRGGGCLQHDEPLEVPDQRQRLIVGLVQKKVAEVLGDPRFGASFQIGMLSSFESFLETAGATSQDESNFDQTHQSDDKIERDGVDRLAVGKLAHSYREAFGEPMPHPKMDSIVESLTSAFETGEKTLVFVRRVRSVTELAEKLARAYDKRLISYLEAELPKTALPRFRQAVNRYEREHLDLDSPPGSEEGGAAEHEPEDQLMIELDGFEDLGGKDTFFSWFFRGDGPPGYLSGAAFKKNRLRGEGSVYSTLFEDNYVADLLGAPHDVVDSLAHVLGRDVDRTIRELRKLAYKRVSETERKKPPRLRIFHAYQEAALVLLSRSSRLSRPAKLIQRLRYSGQPLTAAKDVPANFPDPHEYLDTETFFTLLRRRTLLFEALWPQAEGVSDEKAFLDRERRRELLSAAARLGHSLIDLWLLAIRRIGSLRLGAKQDSENVEELARDFLDLLETQQGTPGTFTAFTELHQIAQQHDLIHAVNFPEVNDATIRELPRLYARSLGEQVPVAGMAGSVNNVVVKQFRLPGYPLILISTEVLQEGEDLHTFCARVIHYGICWTPSAMEQRTGRVDRIGSLIHRQLQGLAEAPLPDNLLQVYYPYLSDTVERLQVSRVLERMNRFLRLTHKSIGKLKDASKIDMSAEFARVPPSVASIDQPLETAFPVSRSLLQGGRIPVEPWRRTERLTTHLRRLVRELKKELWVEWDDDQDDASACGTVAVRGGSLVRANGGPVVADHNEIRVQPFVIFIRSSIHQDASLLHVLSPVGKLPADDGLHVALASVGRELGGIKLCTTRAGAADAYTVTVEGDLLFDPELTQLEEVIGLLERVCVGADQVERRRADTDQDIEVFRKDLREEARRASH